jgi:hypothetical protein
VSGDGEGKIKKVILKHSPNKASKTKKIVKRTAKKKATAPAFEKALLHSLKNRRLLLLQGAWYFTGSLFLLLNLQKQFVAELFRDWFEKLLTYEC